MSVRFTKQQALAHQAKHGFLSLAEQPHAADVIRATRRMNKTELEFSLILEAQIRAGEILRYEYQGITLRWAGIRYTPDFVAFGSPYSLPGEDGPGITVRLIEVKGDYQKMPGHLERAVERFRHARTYWTMFQFELWQKRKTGWTRKL